VKPNRFPSYAAFWGTSAKEPRAFRWLEKAYTEHSWCMLELNHSLVWDPIRSDTRFAEYVRKAGLPEDHGQYLRQP